MNMTSSGYNPPDSNEKILGGLASINRVAEALAMQGHRLVSGCCSVEGFPTVHILANKTCVKMIEDSEAAYYFEGMEDGAWTRKGQFHFLGARVIWIEKEFH
ncbi:TPA: hypothetical protein ACUNF5_004477 [Burkholderia orbicola]